MPLLAIVPMLRTTSSRDMPMPLSEIESVRFSASTSMRIASSPLPSSGLATRSKRSLSSASDAFDTSSRRKTSLLE